MRGKTLGLSVGLVLVAMVALSTSAFAATISGPITKILMLETGAIWITIESGGTPVAKQIYAALPAAQINQLLALALTAQASTSDVTLTLTSSTIRSISCP